ncbi:MAG: hypothetical protein FRX49_01122 [Trebouxia sp. A1-2]|nr:MAG: hypothetical protein FRX49_01122 [Trebouxia sp. A1-2]
MPHSVIGPRASPTLGAWLNTSCPTSFVMSARGTSLFTTCSNDIAKLQMPRCWTSFLCWVIRISGSYSGLKKRMNKKTNEQTNRRANEQTLEGQMQERANKQAGAGFGGPADGLGRAATLKGEVCQSGRVLPAFGTGTMGTFEGTADWKGKLCPSDPWGSAFVCL